MYCIVLYRNFQTKSLTITQTIMLNAIIISKLNLKVGIIDAYSIDIIYIRMGKYNII